jgi:hypothetical protein
MSTVPHALHSAASEVTTALHCGQRSCAVSAILVLMMLPLGYAALEYLFHIHYRGKSLWCQAEAWLLGSTFQKPPVAGMKMGEPLEK